MIRVTVGLMVAGIAAAWIFLYPITANAIFCPTSAGCLIFHYLIMGLISAGVGAGIWQFSFYHGICFLVGTDGFCPIF